jgi:hypothetical protein
MPSYGTAAIGKWCSLVRNDSPACGPMSGLFARICPLALMEFDGEGRKQGCEL